MSAEFIEWLTTANHFTNTLVDRIVPGYPRETASAICIEHECETLLPCYYKHHKLDKYYLMDMVVGDVIVELKSVSDLTSVHRAQLFNYLRLTKKPMGLLINFGQPSLQGERYAYFEDTNECVLLDRHMNPVRREKK